jgi:Holliday junction resolvase RusA-like endonuclease
MTITITIPGTPVGKGRARSAPLMRGGKPVLGAGGRPIVTHHTPEKTASFENLVKLAAQAAMGSRAPLEGAIEVEIALYVMPPASWSNKKKSQALAGIIKPTTKPDADNVIKALFDACNGICWRDDCQVTDIARLTKRYAVQASSVMVVREAA